MDLPLQMSFHVCSMTLKVLIVDDECQERTSLIELCEQRDDVEIVGQAESGLAALRAADELCPDVMLVDVELPDMSGFDLLSAAHSQTGPLSVIVTGGPDNAAAAFAAGALDYLLKPVDAHTSEPIARACPAPPAVAARARFHIAVGAARRFESAPVVARQVAFLSR
jgi:DNA-binding NarL/FixJ family response regulator